jgi:hypothetical protein
MNYIGYRFCTPDENYQVGDIARYSYDWDFENDRSSFDTENPIELPGTCCIQVSDINAEIPNCNYDKRGQIILIGGNEMEYGNDDEEIIIKNAVVLKIVKEI